MTPTFSAEDGVSRALDVLAGRRIAFLTGAGVSTDSGLPDYRGEGSPRRTPMTWQAFLADDAARRRYWIGSHLGWQTFDRVAPNAGHRAIADLEEAGLVTGVVTQNVDGLHLRAGSRRVVEMHGTMRRVVCLVCGQVFDRRGIARRIEADNPWIAIPDSVPLGPDGDVLPETTEGFVVPECRVCGGMLKPEVVFFGEFVPTERFRQAAQLVAGADALVVAGSSLAVSSGLRVVERARRRGIPIVIVNRGATRADARAAVRIDAGTSGVLAALARELPGRAGR